MYHLLIICGPTATGKTALGLRLAKTFGGEILSADSRQVYRGLDIGTGKDVPAGAKLHKSRLTWQGQPVSYYQVSAVRIWGYDLVDFWQPFSASHFYDIGWRIIKSITARHHLPIIVGGTGHYLKTLLQPPDTLGIKPNRRLRQELSTLSLNLLQQRLLQNNPTKWSIMNQSDRSNPRRLVRALEITQTPTVSSNTLIHPVKQCDVYQIGLNLPPAVLKERIANRVAARLTPAFNLELHNIRQNEHYSSRLPSLSATGYKEGLAVISSELDQREAQNHWLKRELHYAKRQRTWFKSIPNINWFHADDKDLYHQVVASVKSWYAAIYGQRNTSS